MAESLVTKFTKYVAEQRDVLEQKLKELRVSASESDSLKTLVSKMSEINYEYSKVTEYYERDSNLPNIDEMFENDPLRLVNGGEYPYCAYAICRLDEKNEVAVNNILSGQIMVVSDGTEFTTNSTAQGHIVKDNGIYTTNNNEKFCVLKAYSKTGGTSPMGSNVVELIEDRMQSGLDYGKTAGYAGTTNYNSPIKYLRLECSNVDNTSVTASTGTISNRITDCIVINGTIPYSSLNVIPPKQSLVLNCSIMNTTVVSQGSVSFTLSRYNSGDSPFLCKNVKLPYCEEPYAAIVKDIMTLNLFATDSIKTLTLQGGMGSSLSWARETEKLHLGNGLTAPVTLNGSSTSNTDSTPFPRLNQLTVSSNSFGINTSAKTLNFKSSMLDRESVLNLFNNLADRTGMTANVLQLSTHSKSIVTDEEKAILTAKNWTLS